MKSIFAVLPIVFMLLVAGCEKYERSEIVLYYLPDSIPQMKVYYEKDANGNEYIAKQERFFNNGQLSQSGYFNESHQKTGEWITYFPQGNVQRIEHYKNGMLDGKYVEYYQNGKKMYVANYKMGLPDGKWIVYDKNGKKNTTLIYENGKLVSEK